VRAKDAYQEWPEAREKYIIKPDGTFVGDFESLYRNCEDPWMQSTETLCSPLKRLIAFRVSELPQRRLMDIGCGTGESCDLFRVAADAEVLGLDVSPTAISKARSKYSLCRFEVASAPEVGDFADMNPTAICMCGLTWCILDRFEEVLATIKVCFPGAFLFHQLTFYGPGQQKYGNEYFTNLDELIPFFSDMTIEETFVHKLHPSDGSHNTLLIAKV
jgi:SAM-dependent methyltransferase